jgi:hypothetical protein
LFFRISIVIERRWWIATRHCGTWNPEKARRFVKEQLDKYIKQVKEWHEDCRGNEQQTKQSLIAPLFTILGYDMFDPRECKPEYRMDFGKGERAATPVDWAFLINGAFAFFVEAKEAGAKITSILSNSACTSASNPAQME